MTWVCFLNKKSEAFECFRIFKEMVENEVEMKIKCLRSDNGGEFVSNESMIIVKRMESEDIFQQRILLSKME